MVFISSENSVDGNIPAGESQGSNIAQQRALNKLNVFYLFTIFKFGFIGKY
jgi:hypothetical protein